MRLSTVAAALAFLAIPTIATAHAGNNDPNMVHVCIGNLSKVVRSVGVGGVCISAPPILAETADHWPKQATAGPRGDKGDKGDPGQTGMQGDPGERGERGLAGNLALAGQICPTGTFVKGFNLSGQVLCGAPGGTGTVPPEFIPIPLPQAEVIQAFLFDLTGSEGNVRILFPTTSVPFLGTLEGYVDVLGFALCDPPDPTALPAASPPIFGCLPNVNVSFVANSPTEATLTVDAPHAFGRVGGGAWTLDGPFDHSGPIDGFARFTGVRIQFHVALVDTEDGRKRFGPARVLSFESQTTTIEVELGSSVFAELGEFLKNVILSNINEQLRTIVGTAVGEALGALPPFDLHP